MSTTKKSLEMTPFRPLPEFLLDGSKYIAPPLKDLKSFNNRVCSNLLYFQTNYMAVSVVNILIFLAFGFNKMIVGLLGIITTGIVVMFTLNKIPQASALRDQYPIAVPVLAIIDAIVCYMALKSIYFFLASILLPVLLAIVHASVRSRGVANKVKNKMEQVGVSVYTNSPMGILLSTIGIEPKDNLD